MKEKYPDDDIYVFEDSPFHLAAAKLAGLIPVPINKNGFKTFADAVEYFMHNDDIEKFYTTAKIK